MSNLFFNGMLALMISASCIANANDAIKTKALKLFPNADTNADGVLSDVEEAALTRQLLQKYPRVDRDGNGILSNAEKRRFLQMVASRSGSKPVDQQIGGAETNRAPHFVNVKYGEHDRQVLDIWLADSTDPTPLAIYIHGGGFRSGSKETVKANEVLGLLNAGISVAAINYRYVTIAPLPAAHHDARRALQFIRSKAVNWNLDKTRIAAFGGSAGAQICMWLAYTDDMADLDSQDPINRESTRLTCIATTGGQTSNGTEFWEKTIGPLLGEDRDMQSLVLPINGEQNPETIRMAMWGATTLQEANEIAARHSALHIVSADDPPIFMRYGMSPSDKPPSNPKRLRGWLIHHVNLGIALKEKTDALQLEAHLQYPGADSQYESLVDFFSAKLFAESSLEVKRDGSEIHRTLGRINDRFRHVDVELIKWPDDLHRRLRTFKKIAFLAHPVNRPAGNLPLLISLHGGGGKKMTVSQQLARSAEVKGLALAELAQKDLVLLEPNSNDSWDATSLNLMLDHFLNDHPEIDRNRIYVMGHSMGGWGTWNWINESAERFAAAAPCGFPAGETGDPSRLVNLPIWAMAGGADGDRTTGVKRMVERLKEAGNKNVKHTEFEGANHGEANAAVFSSVPLVNWMLEFSRGK